MSEVKILVCFAVKEEAAPFRRLVKGREDIAIVVSGIGRDNAERVVTAELNRYRPVFVLTCGFAGGLNPYLTSGTVIFETDDDRLRGKLFAAEARPARFFCSGKIATTAAEKKMLFDLNAADAVEMESEVIQAICWKRKVPCATVRVISDTASEDLPLDFNRLAKADQNLDYAKLITAIIRHPSVISPLLKLAKTTQIAASNLAQVLEKVVKL